MKLKIFFSYGRREVDRDTVKELAGYIKNVDAVDLFWDDDLRSGEDWEKKILREARNANIFIFLLSNHSYPSEYCQKELATFREANPDGLIIPIYFEPCEHLTISAEIKALQALPVHPSSKKLYPCIEWWDKPMERLKGCADIASSVRGEVRRIISEKEEEILEALEQENKLQEQIAKVDSDAEFEWILDKYLAFFSWERKDLGTFQYENLLLLHVNKQRHIAYLPCFYENDEQDFEIKAIILTYYQHAELDLPKVFLLPCGIWQRSEGSQPTLKISENELNEAIIRLEMKVKNYDKSGKIRVVQTEIIGSRDL